MSNVVPATQTVKSKEEIVGWRIGKLTEDIYQQAIRHCMKDVNLWNTFKRDRLLEEIWGTPPLLQFMGMYMELKNDPELIMKMPDFMKMDAIGGPWLYPIDGLKVSRNLVRYVDSLRYIRKYIGSLDGQRVLEFGGGYGGLAYCSHCLYKPASWRLVDLPAAMELQVRHSEELGIKVAPAVTGEEYDIAIAEFSLTELQGAPLFENTEKYLFPAKKIWVRANMTTDDVKVKWLNKLREQFNLTILRETPDMVRINFLVIGEK